MNKIILTGNICQDIELKSYNKKSCVRNSIAVKRDYKNKNNEYDTDFFNISLWGSQADFLNNYAGKGTKILIYGKLLNNNYEAEDGTTKNSNEIIVEHVEILSSKKETNTENTASDEVEVSVNDLFD